LSRYIARQSAVRAWGGRNDTKVDNNMVGPEAYATELATALEQGRNFIEENPGRCFRWPSSGRFRTERS